jgi:hypothetical protein
MLIRNITEDLDNLDKFKLESVGIKEANRKLLLFLDPIEFAENRLTTGRCVQINVASQCGIKNNDLQYGDNTRNNSLIKINVYMYDVIFTSPLGLNDMRNVVFKLKEAYGVESYNNFDIGIKLQKDICLYNDILSTLENSDNNIYNYMNNVTEVPLPKYYTMLHQAKVEHDIVTLPYYDYPQDFTGDELIDHYTEVAWFKLSTWDNLLNILYNKYGFKYNNLEVPTGSSSLISELFPSSALAMIHGYNFIYDSDVPEKYAIRSDNKKGIVWTPMYKYRIKDSIVADLTMLTDQFKHMGKLLENKYGSIRMYYTPLFHGDKLDIHFKDYKNNNPAGFGKTNIERGLSINENINALANERLNNMMIGDDGEV